MRGKFEAPPARRSRAGLFSLFYLVEIRHRQLPLIANAHPLMGASMRVRLHCDYGNDVLLIPQFRDHRATLDRAAADDDAAHAVFRHEVEGALGAALDRLPETGRESCQLKLVRRAAPSLL
jgi:hypothetical protein